MIAVLFLSVAIVGLLAAILFSLPPGELGVRPIYNAPRCVDCGIRTPGGPRCHSCAHEHVETTVRWGAFCWMWTRIGAAACRQSLGLATHVMGAYR